MECIQLKQGIVLNNKLFAFLVLSGFITSSFSISSFAAGFALTEQSTSGMGNAFAGAAASAEDASSLYFNPASMTYLPKSQLVAAVHAINLADHFHNQGSTSLLGTNEGGDLGDLAFIPNIYYTYQIKPDWHVGIGINAPFGLKTEYDPNWLGRIQATKSELKTININPSVAFKINDQFSIGAGISAMRIEAELNRNVSASNTVSIKGDDWGFGYNLGAIFQATPDTRIGVAYRSQVKQNLEGNAVFSPALAARNGPVTANLVLPQTFSVSSFTRLNDRWDLMADITWTAWSKFQQLNITGAVSSTTIENWEDTMRYSLGTSFRYSPELKFRGGLAFDEEAIKDQFRTARIPGNDRTWVTLGAQYKFSESNIVDMAYAHLFLKDASINEAGAAGSLKGTYEGSVDILSAQLTHNF